MNRWPDSRGSGIDASLIVESLRRSQLSDDELQALSQSLSQRFPSVLRRRHSVSREELPFTLEPIPWYRLADRPLDLSTRPSRSLHYAAADYYIQDAGSLLALALCGADRLTRMADIQSGGPAVCDLCSAPGGKATALVEAVDELGSGFVLANETVRSRIPALSHNLSRSGSLRYAVSNLDPEELSNRLAGRFDLVLVDAPCSGQALLSRKRQTKTALTAKQIDHSAARQRRILRSAVKLLRPGGRIVYSTCTFAEQENEAQVAWMLDAFPLEAAPATWLADYESTLQPSSYRLWPHRHGCAGGFAASLRLTEETFRDIVPDQPRGCRDAKSRRRSKTYKDSGFSQLLGACYDALDPLRLEHRESVIWGWRRDAPAWVESVAIAGPELVHRTGQTWKPAHAGSLRIRGVVRPQQQIDVDSATACGFMAGHPIQTDRRGWHVLTWQGRPLGWIKGDGRVGKNHLPTAARLQCELS